MEFLSNLSHIAQWCFITSLKATIVIALIMIIRLLLRDRLPAKWQHALWFLLITRLLLPEIPSTFSIYNLANPVTKAHVQSSSLTDDRVVFAEHTLIPEHQIEKTNTNIASPREAMPLPPSRMNGTSGSGGISVLPLLWLMGVMGLIASVVISNYRLWKTIKHATDLNDKCAIAALNKCRKALNISKASIFVADHIQSPFISGLFHARIYVPRQLSESILTSQLEHIFMHELAHFKRRDIPVAILCTILQALHWFNPFIWFVFYKMRCDREAACDELVLHIIGEHRTQEYGTTLLSLLRTARRINLLPVTLGLSDERHNLKRRIERIAGFTRKSMWWSVLALLFILAIACFALTDAVLSDISYHSKWQAQNDKDESFYLYFDGPLDESISGEYHQQDSDYITYFEGERIGNNHYKLNMLTDILGHYQSLVSNYTLHAKPDKLILMVHYNSGVLPDEELHFSANTINRNDRDFAILRENFSQVKEIRLRLKKYFAALINDTDETELATTAELLHQDREITLQQLSELNSSQIKERLRYIYWNNSYVLWNHYPTRVDSIWFEQEFSEMSLEASHYVQRANFIHRLRDYQAKDYKRFYANILEQALPLHTEAEILIALKSMQAWVVDKERLQRLENRGQHPTDEQLRRHIQMIRESPELVRKCDARIDELAARYPENENIKTAVALAKHVELKK